MKFLYIIISVLVFASQTLYGQLNQVNLNGVTVSISSKQVNTTSPSKYNLNTCEENFVLFDFNNANASVVSNFVIAATANADVLLLYAQLTDPNLIVNATNRTITIVSLAEGHSSLQVPIKASCENFKSPTLNSTSKLIFSYASNSLVAQQSIDFIITSSVLAYNAADDNNPGQNIAYIGHKGDVFTRIYNFYTPSAEFNGGLHMEETIPSSPTAQLQIVSLELKINGIRQWIETTNLVDPLTNKLIKDIALSHVPLNATIEIFETVKIIGCPTGTGKLIFTYGCETSNCIPLREMDLATSLGVERPNLTVTDMNLFDFGTCLASPNNSVHRKFRVKNEGLARANNVYTSPRGGSSSTFPINIVPFSSVTITASNPLTNIIFDAGVGAKLSDKRGFKTNTTNTDLCFQDDMLVFEEGSVRVSVLEPGEYFDVEWDEKTCCVSNDNTNNYTLNSYGLIDTKCDNECGGYYANSSGYFVATDDHANLKGLNQIETTGLNNMFGCFVCSGGCGSNPAGTCTDNVLNNPLATSDYTETLKIKNSGFKLYIGNSYDFFPIDYKKFKLVIDFAVDGQLLLAPQALANRGNLVLKDGNGVSHYPISQTVLTKSEITSLFGTTDIPAGATDAGARAVFEFDPTILFPGYNITTYKDYNLELLMASFINSLETSFEVSGVCGRSSISTGPSNYFTRTYLVPDGDDCPTCKLAIGSYSDYIIVNCPGCVFPGVLVQGYELQRITVGEVDADNNGLQDLGTVTATGSPNLKMVTDNDIFKAKTTSTLWVGTTKTYGSGSFIGSLEQDLGFTARFLTNIARLDKIGPYGNQFDVNITTSQPIVLEYTQGGVSYHFTYTDNSNNIWTTDNSGNFLFQFPIALIRLQLQSKYGFSTAQAALFSYEAGDRSEITVYYKVKPDFDLGSKYYESIDVSTRCFYSDRIKNVLVTNEADPASPYGLSGSLSSSQASELKPYMNYICEAYGSGFILADIKQYLNYGGSDGSACEKRLASTQSISADDNGQQLDLFPYEIRTFNRLQKTSFVVAKGYVMDKDKSEVQNNRSFRLSNSFDYAEFGERRYFKDLNIVSKGNAIEYHNGQPVVVGELFELDWNYNATITYRTIPTDAITYDLAPDNKFSDGNEFSRQFMSLVFHPDCSKSILGVFNYVDNPQTRINLDPDFINSFVVQGPKSLISSYNYSTQSFATTPIPVTSLTGDYWYYRPSGLNNSSIISITKVVANVDIFKKVSRIPFKLTAVDQSANVFMYFTTKNGKVILGDLIKTNPDNTTQVYQKVQGVYQLGNLTNGQLFDFNLEVQFQCNNIKDDELYLHVGYTCDNSYPTLVNGVLDKTPCGMMDESIRIIESLADMSLSYSSTVTCTNVTHELKMTSLLDGGLYDFNPSVQLPSNLIYKTGSAKLTIFEIVNNIPIAVKDASTGVPISFPLSDPSISSSNLLAWDLTNLAGLDDYYIHGGGYVVLTFDTEPTCLQNTSITASCIATTYCNSPIDKSLLTPSSISFPSSCITSTVTITGEVIRCLGESVLLTATPSQALTANATYTWYKQIGGVRQLPALYGPSNLNIYTYNNLTASTTFEVEFNNGNGCVATTTQEVTLNSPEACCIYKLGDITLNCSTTTQNICVPLTAVRNVPTGIIGMDFCLKYDPTVMKYTGPIGNSTSSALGTVVTNGGLFGATYTAYNDAINGVLRVSIYYSGSGSGLASFKGSGEVVCLNFSVPNSTARQGVFPIAMCSVNDLQEAYTLEEKAACWKPGSLTIKVQDIVKGTLRNPLYNNSIIGYSAVPSFGYAVTTVAAVGTDCDLQNTIPSTLILGPASFTLSLNGATKIKIKRDINGDYVPSNPRGGSARKDYLKFVNGSDTWKIHRITTMDPILNLNQITPFDTRLAWYNMVAADVNMNGHIRANDISLVQERIINKRTQFPQVWNNNLNVPSLDWRFVDQTTVNATASFRKSLTYPNSDGQGFHREYVPNIPLCLDARKNCEGQIPELYYGVMLGDVYQSGAAATQPGTNPYLRTSTEPSYITVDAKHSQYLGNNVYRVPVKHKYSGEYADFLFAVDMYMDYNQEKIRVNNVLYTTVTTAGGTSMVWNNADEDQFILTSYVTLDSMAASGICYYLDIEKYTDEPFKKADFGDLMFLLNGEEVEARIETGETITGTTDGQSSIKPHVTVIPNPASGAAMIDFAVSNNSNDNKIIITDVLGRMVKSFEHVQNFGMLDLNTEDLAAGMYIITLKGENGFGLSEKFQVRK